MDVTIDKWDLFAQLRKGHEAFSVKYRTLTVLNALLSFLPHRVMSDSDALVVFPSNRSLADRAHGMPESTLRRHLATLIDAGLIRRHDSPNGKRYAARTAGGNFVHAFGFDLRPLLERAGEIADAARAADAAADEHRRLRERFTLVKRDAIKLAADAVAAGMPGDWAEVDATLVQLHRAGRRKLPLPILHALVKEAETLLARITHLVALGTPETSGDDARNERHIQNSKEEYLEEEAERKSLPRVAHEVPLNVVLGACTEAQSYAQDPIRSWKDLAILAHMLHRFIGIDSRVWGEALQQMGERDAPVVLCCMMERLDNIRNPAGYLRTLCRKASMGRLSIPAMVRAVAGKAEVDSCQPC